MRVKKIVVNLAISTMLFNLTSYSINANAATNTALKPVISTATKVKTTSKPTTTTTVTTKSNIGLFATIIRYGTNWCPHCKNEDKVLKQMQQKYGSRLAVQYVNIEAPENRSYVAKYNIKGIPFVVILNNKNQEVQRFAGYRNESQITSLLKSSGLLK